MNIDGTTILILEDEPIIGLALEDMLADHGASVLFASGIEEAQALVAAKQIHSAILDVNVHGARSYAVADALAARNVPFVFATGYGDRAHPPKFAAIPTLSKPYSFEDIAAALRAVGLQAVA